MPSKVALKRDLKSFPLKKITWRRIRLSMRLFKKELRIPFSVISNWLNIEDERECQHRNIIIQQQITPFNSECQWKGIDSQKLEL